MEEKIKDLLKKSIEEAGYQLYDVTYTKENNVNTLTLIIDKEGYININDCVTVNSVVEPLLDKADLIDESYVLDVCSREKG